MVKEVYNSEKGESRKPTKSEEKTPKSGAKRKHETKPAEFPIDERINDYGFLHFGVGVLKALNWNKGMAIKISKNPDGSITVRKA